MQNKKELDYYIQLLKKTSAKNTQQIAVENRPVQSELSQNNSFKYDRFNKMNKKQRQKSIRKMDRVLSNKRDNSKRSNKNVNVTKSNVYDSFTMSNRFIEISSTPDNKTRYPSNKNLSNKGEFGTRKR